MKTTRLPNGKVHAPSLVLGVIVALLIGLAFWGGTRFTQGGDTKKIAQSGEGTSSTGGKLLTLAENTVSNIASEASLSVVNIDTSKTVSIPTPFSFFGGSLGMGEDGAAPKFKQQGSGSGVIFRSEGYILTNNHVVGSADDIKVTLSDNRKFPGKVVGRDSFTDLAVVKIEAKDLPVARFGSSKTLRPGDWAIAIGSPMGLDHTVTLGIISAIGRTLSDLHDVDLIQTDAAINPGNSGGPLLNIHGEVVGLNTAIRGDAQNIGFAIPVDVFKEVSDELLKNGKIARPYVGIYMRDLDEQMAKSLGLAESDQGTGVVVAGVARGGPAESAGISQGDLIRKVDGQPVKGGKDVQVLVAKHKPGDKINFLLSRDGKLVPVEVKLIDFPENR